MHIGKTFVTVRCIIQNVQDKVLLLRRSKNEVGNVGLWELPGGHIDFGEHPNTSVVREAFEESGIKIRTPSILNISSRLNRRNEHSICMTYLAHVQLPQVILSDEHDEYLWISPLKASKVAMTIRTSIILKDYIRDLLSSD